MESKGKFKKRRVVTKVVTKGKEKIMRCNQCKFFEPPGKFENLGICHFSPPIVYVENANTYEADAKTAWARVRATDWCGKGENPGNRNLETFKGVKGPVNGMPKKES